MKKIYYLQTYPVKIGDVIEHNGFRVTVTEELIGLNPELFVVKDSIQELLDKAKRDYPVGTMFESWYQKDKHNLIPQNSTLRWESNVITVATDEFPLGMATLYKDGRWAEVLPLKFTTEDGVDIYGDMKTYSVSPNRNVDTLCLWHGSWDGCRERDGYKYFYHKENALAYIEKHKEKTLEDYENSLSLSVWGWFKTHEPKLYYTKILQLIADDLNDARYIHIRGNTSYHLSKAHEVNLHMGGDEGCVYFKSKELAFKARSILGDKLKYLFN